MGTIQCVTVFRSYRVILHSISWNKTFGIFPPESTFLRDCNWRNRIFWQNYTYNISRYKKNSELNRLAVCAVQCNNKCEWQHTECSRSYTTQKLWKMRNTECMFSLVSRLEYFAWLWLKLPNSAQKFFHTTYAAPKLKCKAFGRNDRRQPHLSLLPKSFCTVYYIAGHTCCWSMRRLFCFTWERLWRCLWWGCGRQRSYAVPVRSCHSRRDDHMAETRCSLPDPCRHDTSAHRAAACSLPITSAFLSHIHMRKYSQWVPGSHSILNWFNLVGMPAVLVTDTTLLCRTRHFFPNSGYNRQRHLVHLSMEGWSGWVGVCKNNKMLSPSSFFFFFNVECKLQ